MVNVISIPWSSSPCARFLVLRLYIVAHEAAEIASKQVLNLGFTYKLYNTFYQNFLARAVGHPYLPRWPTSTSLVSHSPQPGLVPEVQIPDSDKESSSCRLLSMLLSLPHVPPQAKSSPPRAGGGEVRPPQPASPGPAWANNNLPSATTSTGRDRRGRGAPWIRPWWSTPVVEYKNTGTFTRVSVSGRIFSLENSFTIVNNMKWTILLV